MCRCALLHLLKFLPIKKDCNEILCHLLNKIICNVFLFLIIKDNTKPIFYSLKISVSGTEPNGSGCHGLKFP